MHTWHPNQLMSGSNLNPQLNRQTQQQNIYMTSHDQNKVKLNRPPLIQIDMNEISHEGTTATTTTTAATATDHHFMPNNNDLSHASNFSISRSNNRLQPVTSPTPSFSSPTNKLQSQIAFIPNNNNHINLMQNQYHHQHQTANPITTTISNLPLSQTYHSSSSQFKHPQNFSNQNPRTQDHAIHLHNSHDLVNQFPSYNQENRHSRNASGSAFQNNHPTNQGKLSNSFDRSTLSQMKDEQKSKQYYQNISQSRPSMTIPNYNSNPSNHDSVDKKDISNSFLRTESSPQAIRTQQSSLTQQQPQQHYHNGQENHHHQQQYLNNFHNQNIQQQQTNSSSIQQQLTRNNSMKIPAGKPQRINVDMSEFLAPKSQLTSEMNGVHHGLSSGSSTKKTTSNSTERTSFIQSESHVYNQQGECYPTKQNQPSKSLLDFIKTGINNTSAITPNGNSNLFQARVNMSIPSIKTSQIINAPGSVNTQKSFASQSIPSASSTTANYSQLEPSQLQLGSTNNQNDFKKTDLIGSGVLHRNSTQSLNSKQKLLHDKLKEIQEFSLEKMKKRNDNDEFIHEEQRLVDVDILDSAFTSNKAKLTEDVFVRRQNAIDYFMKESKQPLQQPINKTQLSQQPSSQTIQSQQQQITQPQQVLQSQVFQQQTSQTQEEIASEYRKPSNPHASVITKATATQPFNVGNEHSAFQPINALHSLQKKLYFEYPMSNKLHSPKSKQNISLEYPKSQNNQQTHQQQQQQQQRQLQPSSQISENIEESRINRIASSPYRDQTDGITTQFPKKQSLPILKPNNSGSLSPTKERKGSPLKPNKESPKKYNNSQPHIHQANNGKNSPQKSVQGMSPNRQRKQNSSLSSADFANATHSMFPIKPLSPISSNNTPHLEQNRSNKILVTQQSPSMSIISPQSTAVHTQYPSHSQQIHSQVPIQYNRTTTPNDFISKTNPMTQNDQNLSREISQGDSSVMIFQNSLQFSNSDIDFKGRDSRLTQQHHSSSPAFRFGSPKHALHTPQALPQSNNPYGPLATSHQFDYIPPFAPSSTSTTAAQNNITNNNNNNNPQTHQRSSTTSYQFRMENPQVNRNSNLTLPPQHQQGNQQSIPFIKSPQGPIFMNKSPQNNGQFAPFPTYYQNQVTTPFKVKIDKSGPVPEAGAGATSTESFIRRIPSNGSLLSTPYQDYSAYQPHFAGSQFKSTPFSETVVKTNDGAARSHLQTILSDNNDDSSALSSNNPNTYNYSHNNHHATTSSSDLLIDQKPSSLTYEYKPKSQMSHSDLDSHSTTIMPNNNLKKGIDPSNQKNSAKSLIQVPSKGDEMENYQSQVVNERNPMQNNTTSNFSQRNMSLTLTDQSRLGRSALTTTQVLGAELQENKQTTLSLQRKVQGLENRIKKLNNEDEILDKKIQCMTNRKEDLSAVRQKSLEDQQRLLELRQRKEENVRLLKQIVSQGRSQSKDRINQSKLASQNEKKSKVKEVKSISDQQKSKYREAKSQEAIKNSAIRSSIKTLEKKLVIEKIVKASTAVQVSKLSQLHKIEHELTEQQQLRQKIEDLAAIEKQLSEKLQEKISRHNNFLQA